MDPSQTLPGAIFAQFEVHGQRAIMMFDPTPLPMKEPSKLSYYHGGVKSGSLHNRLEACNATIIRFNDLEDGKEVYDKLNQVDHPSVLKALGLANGVGENINHTFLALTPFDTTLATYIQKDIGSDESGRLKEDFITLINDTIDGLEGLHDLGYYCPGLQGDDVAVITQSGFISAKIWKFQKCDPGMEEKQKDEDWISLGSLIIAVSSSKEVSNLMKRIKKGLKGKSIMKDSALLTVRKKFENVLAFNLHISIRCQQKPDQSPKKNDLEATESQKKNDLKVTESQKKNDLRAIDLCAAKLEKDLDRRLAWTTPGWTQKRGLPISTRTLRGFVNQLRIFIEHEIFYIPEEIKRKLTVKELLEDKKQADLEHQLQGECCGMAFRAVQRLVTELDLEY